MLLWCATPDGVLRAKLSLSQQEFDFVKNIYYKQQNHDNLFFYLDQKIKKANYDGGHKGLYSQVMFSTSSISTKQIL